NDLSGQLGKILHLPFTGISLHRKIPSLDIAKLAKPLEECTIVTVPIFAQIAHRVRWRNHRNAIDSRVLLRVCASDCSREQQTRNKLAPSRHSITSSA